MNNYFKIIDEDTLKDNYEYLYADVISELENLDRDLIHTLSQEKSNKNITKKVNFVHDMLFYIEDPKNPDSLELMFRVTSTSGELNSLIVSFEGGIK